MIQRILIAVLALFLFNIAIAEPNSHARFSWETLTPDQKVQHYKVADNAEITHIVVKFRENSGVRLRGGILQHIGDVLPPGLLRSDVLSDMDQVQSIAKAKGKGLFKTFRTLTEDDLDNLKESGEAKSGKTLENLNLYHTITFDKIKPYKQVEAQVRRLNKLKSVEIAYAQPKAVIATHLVTPNFESDQGYKDASGNGINAIWASTQPGGKGTGIKIVDIEGEWNTTHEDLPPFFYDSGNYVNLLSWRNHGTAVLGVISGQDNGFGVTGIVPNASVGVQSLTGSLSDNITTAATQVGSGGIVLIELQSLGPADATPCTCNVGQCNNIAMEYFQANFAAIETATANGVIVVEAAGNGSANFDDPAYNGFFNRSTRDSGAIMVGASLSTQRSPACFTNFGGRIDLHAWGENVVTTGYGGLFKGEHGSENQDYTNGFGGTSSASPIVVGAVASVQGIVLASGQTALTPAEMRTLLVQNGRPQTGGLSDNIGPLPNIRAAVEALGGSTTPTVTLNANPTSIQNGESSLLSWSSSNTTSCTASGAWSGSQFTNGGLTVFPTTTSTYTLSCTGAGGTASDSVTISVNAGSTPPTVSISASPTTITDSESSLLTWTSSNATSCTASGSWLGSKPTSGSLNVFPGSTRTYTLSCTGTGGTAADSVTITVNSGSGAPTVSISASPTTIFDNESSLLSWSSTNATSCVASGAWLGSKSTSGSLNVFPGSTRTYTLSCTGPGGTTLNSVTITVSASAPPPTVYISGYPLTINAGSNSYLFWTSTNSTSCTASGGWSGNKQVSGGGEYVYPSTSTTYYLTCSGAGGSAINSIRVTVN